MKTILKFLNSPLFDVIGGVFLWIGAVLYFIGYKQIDVDTSTFIFAALLVIGFDCWSSGFERFYRCKNRKVEYRCKDCSVMDICPAANTGVIYPCPHFEDRSRGDQK